MRRLSIANQLGEISIFYWSTVEAQPRDNCGEPSELRIALTNPIDWLDVMLPMRDIRAYIPV